MHRLIRALAAVFLLAVAGCASLPASVERTESRALADTGGTGLGRAAAARAAAHPGKTGIYTLQNPRDAFAARVLLARAAERSLDLQYYIWRPDTTGGLLAEALWQAAERGVRVRLLLDDANTKGLDEGIAVLDAHPNIEVRLFNPFANRGMRLVNFATDFARLNRRMHNKAFIADNQFAIVGGRNVGDEYFGADTPVAFTDLDALAVGAVVPQVSAAFDEYWNSASAYPAASLVGPAAATVAQILEAWSTRQGEQAERYVEALRATPLVQELLAGGLAFEWTSARVLHDDPGKVLHPPDRHDLHMLPRLEEALRSPARQMDLVSPYFVPTEAGTEALLEIAKRGVAMRILTNSLAATDVPAVHAGYSRYREALLRGGVRLYELKPSIPDTEFAAERKRRGLSGSSGASLHAKTFAVDRNRIFIGSFNFDPRSARLNTEMGILVESEAIALLLSDALDRNLPQLAYEVVLADGRLQWIERTAAGEIRHDTEPGVGTLKRFWVDFLSILPFEWML
jgi:putative cardiolipin synthase